ncbi:MAG TPA: AIPR family protein [Bacteroidia bacterium]|nr:AIPR family protein [Bacteroidia bacterium]
MDSIVKSYLNNFVKKFGINDHLSESEKFEYFSAYTILAQEFNNNIDKNDLNLISTGKAKGVDTLAFSINDRLITNSDEIESFENQSLYVNVYAIQSKTSGGFEDKEIANFLDVVIDFFNDNPMYNISEFDVSREILKGIKDKIGNVREINLFCYYVCLGINQENKKTIDDTIKIKKTSLINYGLFNSIEILLIDKETLLAKHKKAISPLRTEFKFENKISLSSIPNIDEAYIGFLPFSEFKKLIMDKEQEKIKSLFNENLRDFLGFDNPINKKIKETLENRKFSEFSLLNNGITVVAEVNRGKGNTLILENYQIVNGCQTSNVLFECRNINEIDNVLIPLKVVITKNEELRDQIILSTNSQSSFTEEQLFAITQFQKKLEDFYKSQNDNIYYERRTNQYSDLSRSQVIDIKEQIKSFMAIFFDIPHLVSGNIGKVIMNFKSKFFQRNHDPLPYYIAGLISKKWEYLLSKDETNFYSEFNKFRYHIFMGFRYLVEDLKFQEDFLLYPKQYSIKSERGRESSYEKILKNVRDNLFFEETIKLAIEIFKKTEYDRPKAAYSNPITQDYIKLITEYLNSE